MYSNLLNQLNLAGARSLIRAAFKFLIVGQNIEGDLAANPGKCGIRVQSGVLLGCGSNSAPAPPPLAEFLHEGRNRGDQ